MLKLTVDLGYSGQTIKPKAFASIRRFREALQREELDIGRQADGNVNALTIPEMVRGRGHADRRHIRSASM
ncbi:MAG: hypothetical protein GXW96_12340 [Christensenellaceae bacterium]|nr:hypothetical protein [Christensenellaceae bacterium]